MRMMRRGAHSRGPIGVLYIANSEKIGGGNRVLMDIVEGLDLDRFVPLIATPRDGALVTWARDHRIEVTFSRDGDWLGRGGLLRRAATLAMTANRRHIGIVHAMAPMCYRAAGLAGQWLGVPRVCHLGFPPGPGELERSFRFGPEAVVACYHGQARDVEPTVRRIRPDCRLIAIPNGVDTGLYRPNPITLTTHRDLRGGASHVVAIVGHLSEVKGYPTFLHAAARIARQFPECRFLALGGETTGPGPLARFERLASDLGISDRMRFLGFRADVADVLRAADVVVLPSLDEGLPLAVLEAMSCAKPVVATPVGGVPEAVAHEETGLLVPLNDPGALAAAVTRLLADGEFAGRMGVAGRRRIESQFSVTRLVSDVEALYRQLTTSSRQLARRTAEPATRATTSQAMSPTDPQSYS